MAQGYNYRIFHSAFVIPLRSGLLVQIGIFMVVFALDSMYIVYMYIILVIELQVHT